jgi:hypothetical protein
VLDRSFKANASLISPWVPLVRSPYADGFYSRYITDSRYSFRRKPFQPAFSQHEGLSTTVGHIYSPDVQPSGLVDALGAFVYALEGGVSFMCVVMWGGRPFGLHTPKVT